MGRIANLSVGGVVCAQRQSMILDMAVIVRWIAIGSRLAMATSILSINGKMLGLDSKRDPNRTAALMFKPVRRV